MCAEQWAAASAGAEPHGPREPHSPLGLDEPSCGLTPDFFQSVLLLDLHGMIGDLNCGSSPLPTNKINHRFPPLSPRAAGKTSSALLGSLPLAVITQTRGALFGSE